jgi:chitin disaccharide deacetylase
MRFLVVNADDFGLSVGINAGIVQAHRAGVVTSASLMVRQPEARAAAALAAQLPELGVGLHVDLGEWIEEENGDWIPVYRWIDPADALAVEAEVESQLDLFEALVGRSPTHIDSHQHAHREEPLRSILGRAAKRLRVPLRHHSQFRYRGDFYGSGAIGVGALRRIIASLPPGATEICCHPAATADAPSRYREERVVELASLTDPRVADAVAAGAVTLTNFAARPASVA